MILRREVFERVGGFSQAVGRTGNGFPLSCEETELCIRARAAIPHGRFLIQPAAKAWHKVPASRLTWSYFFLRCYAEGLSKAYVASMARQPRALATERRYVLRTLTSGMLRGLGELVLAFDPGGIQRSAAILAGLACAAAGFAAGKLKPMSVKQSPPAVGLADPEAG